MKRPRPARRALFAALCLIPVIAVAAWQVLPPGRDALATVQVTRSSIENSVTALGTLQPRRYVDVGAQASGQIQKIHVEAGDTVIEQAAGRVLLESRRFDRTPQGGRVGMVSLEVYDRQYIGAGTSWVDTAQRSDRAGPERLSTEDVQTIALLDAFGSLIANTDRHHGNLSLLLRDHRWRLAPAYDMLPMLYAPVNGELVERRFSERPLHPTANTLAEWPQARALALRFWQAAAADERISSGFRALAQANHDTVQRLG